MSNKNDDSKYQVANTDEYRIKTTKGGQKYLICHFMPVQEDNWDKKLRRKNNGNKLGKCVLKDNF